MRDWGYGPVETADTVQAIGDYIDYVKLRQWAIWYLDADLVREKIAIYRRHDIIPLSGGIVFELAYQQEKVAATLDALRELGLLAIEISDNIIDMSITAKQRAIEQAIAADLEVLFEYGKKYVDRAFEVEAAANEIKSLLSAGASRVIVERSQLDTTLGPRADGQESNRVIELVDRVGLENIIFEAETTEHQMWLLRAFGPDVNLGPNITAEQVGLKIEPARSGIGRDEGYSLFERLS